MSWSKRKKWIRRRRKSSGTKNASKHYFSLKSTPKLNFDLILLTKRGHRPIAAMQLICVNEIKSKNDTTMPNLLMPMIFLCPNLSKLATKVYGGELGMVYYMNVQVVQGPH